MGNSLTPSWTDKIVPCNVHMCTIYIYYFSCMLKWNTLNTVLQFWLNTEKKLSLVLFRHHERLYILNMFYIILCIILLQCNRIGRCCTKLKSPLIILSLFIKGYKTFGSVTNTIYLYIIYQNKCINRQILKIYI